MTDTRSLPADTDGAPESAPLSRRRVTVEDVARAAGVSMSAVSKVVRQAYGVSPQMRARVNAAIEELGYRPHAGARAMRGRSYTIGVMLVEVVSPFQGSVAQGITDALAATPYQDVIMAAGSSATGLQRRLDALMDRQVDGLILVAPFIDAEVIEELGSKLPTVTVALHGPARNFDTVVDDEHLGSQLMVDHLVAAGHRHILHTSMPAEPWEGRFQLSHTARRHGFEEAMRAHGLEPDVIETFYSEQGGYEAATEALNRSQPPTAIFAGADIAAFGVMRAAHELGLKVPKHLTVTGYDNIAASSIARVALTTIDQSGQLTGEASVRLLLERIGGRTTPRHFVVKPRLVRRRTSAAPPRP